MVGVTEGRTLPKVYKAKSTLGVEVELELIEKSRNTIIFKDARTGVLYKVHVRKAGNGKYVIDVNGVEYVVHSSENEGVFINFAQPLISEITAEVAQKEKQIKGADKPVQMEPGVLSSPISGKVVEVVVKPGSTVNIGDTVILMESMKMIVEVKSHLTGIVEEVYVKPGMAVKRGDKLLKISRSQS